MRLLKRSHGSLSSAEPSHTKGTRSERSAFVSLALRPCSNDQRSAAASWWRSAWSRLPSLGICFGECCVAGHPVTREITK